MSPLTSVGPAVPGWPASGAVVDGSRLHVVSRNLDRPRMIELDTTDFRVIRQRLLPHGAGAWGLTSTPNGVYVGLFGAVGVTNLYRLTAQAVEGAAALAVNYIWDLTASQTGVVYGVTSQPALIVAYDISTRRATTVAGLTPSQRPRTCLVVDGRLVVAGTADGRAFAADLALTGGGVRNLLPTALRDDDTVYCSAVTGAGRLAVGTAGPDRDTPAIAVFPPGAPDHADIVRLPRESLVDTITVSGGSVYATARPSGSLYRLDLPARRLFRLDVPVAMSETRSLDVIGNDVIGASADGTVWRYDRVHDRTTTVGPTSLGLDLQPQRAQSICASIRRVDVGGSFSITRHNLMTQTSISRFVPGEPKAMVDVTGTTYMALYPIGEIWSWPQQADAPYRLTQLDSDQLRPVSLAYLSQLDALVCTTTDDRRRSILNTIDPTTGRVDMVVNPLGAQTVAGVTTQGSTIFLGGSGDAPSVAAYDAVAGSLLWTVSRVIPGGGFVLGLQVVAGRLAVTTSRGWFTTIDVGSQIVAPPVRVAQQGGQLRRDGDTVLLATGNELLRLDPPTSTVTTVASRLDGQYWNWPPMDVDADGRAWLMQGRQLAHT